MKKPIPDDDKNPLIFDCFFVIVDNEFSHRHYGYRCFHFLQQGKLTDDPNFHKFANSLYIFYLYIF